MKTLITLCLVGLAYMWAGPSQAQDMPPGWEKWPAECTASNAQSCHNLGERHRLGLRTPVDYPKAVELFRKGCAAGIWQSCENGGILLWNGQKGVTENVKDAMLMLNTGCQSGSWRACSVLASIFDKGAKGIAPNPEMVQALEYLACKQGSRIDCGISAMDQTDIRETMTLFARGCDLGDVFSCLEAGRRLQPGQGVPVNPAFARRFYERGCKAGEASTKTKEYDACLYVLRIDDPQARLATTQAEAARLCDLGTRAACSWLAEVNIAAKAYRPALIWLGKSCQLKEAEACRAEKEFTAFIPQYEKWEDNERAITEREAERNAKVDGLIANGAYAEAMNWAINDYGSPEMASRVLEAANAAGRLKDFDDFTFVVLSQTGWNYRLTTAGRHLVKVQSAIRKRAAAQAARELPTAYSGGGGGGSGNYYTFDFGLAPSASNAEKAAYHRKEQEMCSSVSWC